MRQADNIALIGFRTTGKSLTGKILADQTGKTFVDMDEMLVHRLGQNIDAFVRSHGWDSFRKAESELLLDLSRHAGLVVATGGGIVLGKSNRDILRRSFFVVWLRASEETILSRLASDPKTVSQRPPLTQLPPAEEVARLLRERTPLYTEAAELSLETDSDPPEAISSIIHSRFAGREER